jgi:glycosyltransferase involved in cell wall biosynthesis
MVKVLHVASGRLYGGIERMLTTLAESKGLPGGLHFDFAVASEGRLSSELRERGVQVHALGEVRLSHPGSLLRARRHLRTILGEQQYAAVVCHAPWSHAIFGGVVRSVGLPSVLWQHDRATGAALMERACRAAGADLVICNSNWTAESAASWQPNVPRRVIYCPVTSTTATEGDREEIRGILGATSSEVVILSASRLEPWKGHLDLIRALARLGTRSWALWIAGGAQRSHERDHAAAIEAEMRRLGLGSRVKLLGERSDVRRLLAGADLLAQANVEPEPFGIIFAEALLAGVAVVTTNMGGAPEIVDDACGRLVAPRNLEALAAALDELISNAPLRASLGAAGPAHAAARCDPSIVLPRLEAALLSIRVPTAA